MATDRESPGTATSDTAAWRARLQAIGEESGYLEAIGARHMALFSDLAPTLLVTFEDVSETGFGGATLPLGYRIASARGWSSLSLIADGATWFRDRHLWGYLDRLIDDGFFEDFDRVTFYGAGMGAHAAAAHSVAAPGCTVLALAPRATLDPAVAPWDRRDLSARRLDWHSRFAYAPELLAGAGAAFLLHDPDQALDAAHAALFRGASVTHLRARLVGPEPEAALDRLGLLEPLIEAACEDRLDPALFYRLWRARRRDPGFLGRLVVKAQSSGSAQRLAWACRAALREVDHPRLRQLLAQAETAGK